MWSWVSHQTSLSFNFLIYEVRIGVIMPTWECSVMHVKESESHSVMSDSFRPCGPYSPWNPPGQNTGVGSLSLLWGIFPTQRSNPGLLHCRWILYQPQGKSKIKVPANLVPGEDSPSGLQRDIFLLCPHMAERERSSLPLKKN